MTKEAIESAWLIIKEGQDGAPSADFDPCPMRIPDSGGVLYTGTCQKCKRFISEDDRTRCLEYAGG